MVLSVTISALSLVASCTKSTDVVVCHTESAIQSGFAVSQAEALSMLERDLGAIYGENGQTRAETTRRVKAIESVKFNRNTRSTRGESIPDDVENLLYVVEFENGQGSAVLGADKRVEPVLAILDETVLTAEDLENSTSPDADTDDLTAFVSGMIYNSALSQIENYAAALPPVDIKTTRYETRYDTLNYRKINPLLNTKWGQGYPYNNSCPNNCPAGCGVIASAQIMKYYQYPDPLVIDGQSFSWMNINNYTYPNVSFRDTDINQIGGFIYTLGKKMKATYEIDGTSVTTSNAASALRKLGYSVSKVSNYNTNSIITEIRNLRPVYTRGNSESGGHGWVIDGLLSYSVKEWLYEIETDPRKIPVGSDGVVNKTLVATTSVGRFHCNYGYDGDCDGYYTYGIFDLSTGLPAEFIESTEGDINVRYPDDYNFNKNIKYFTINKN